MEIAGLGLILSFVGLIVFLVVMSWIYTVVQGMRLKPALRRADELIALADQALGPEGLKKILRKMETELKQANANLTDGLPSDRERLRRIRRIRELEADITSLRKRIQVLEA